MRCSDLTLLQTDPNAYVLENVVLKGEFDTVEEKTKLSDKIADMDHEDFRQVDTLKDLKSEIKGENTTKVLSKAISKLSTVLGAVSGGAAIINGAAGDTNGAAINAAVSVSSLILGRVAAMKEKSISKDQLAQVYHLKAKVEKSRDYIEDKKDDPNFKDNKQAQKYFNQLNKLYDNLDKLANKMELKQLKSRTLDKEGEYGMQVGKIQHDVKQSMTDY